MSGTGNSPGTAAGGPSKTAREALLDEILDDPCAHYSTPEEVLKAEAWSREEKKKILECMKQDAVDLGVASSESMSGGEQIDLKRVNNALLELEDNG